MPNPASIAIIGGGFSGAIVAIHLLHRATRPVEIHLVERRAAVGSGVAYSTPFDCHVLNVAAAKMSAFPDQPHHFLQWLQAQPGYEAATPTTFAPRKLYGTYIQSLLTAAQSTATPGVHLIRWVDEAEAVLPPRATVGATVQLKSGRQINSDRVILALGNFAPGDPPVADPTFYQSDRYISYAWSADALPSIPPDAPLLLIGSGLTMADWAIALKQQGHRGTIHAVSRRGLLPQAHCPANSYPAFLEPAAVPDTVRSLLRRIRQEVEQATAQGQDWRNVVDALRPSTQRIWRSLPLIEQRRFLRHLRPYWEVHRHRVAPQVAADLETLIQTGQLVLHAGRVQSYQEAATGVTVTLRQRQTGILKTLGVKFVVNCTGPDCNYRKLTHPLIVNLLKAGFIQPDPLGLGVEVTEQGALLDRNGVASSWLYTLGSPQKGCLWETTAVPEIRQQAIALSQICLPSAVEEVAVP